MLRMEEILCELGGAGTHEDHLNQQQGLPPGFRFHPTDEELITFYLASKVLNGRFCGVNIAEVDLNRCEPWELPDAAKMGEREWYFFSLRDRKYPTGLRTNRATCAGYWKATGKDREVYGSGRSDQGVLVGMKKTLVFYKGRAPRGEKTKWVMHEYRLDVDFFHRHSCKEEWVICRILHKIGEKRPNLLIQGQSHHHHHHLNLIGGCSTSSAAAAGGGGGCGLLLPPLLESPAAAAALVESHSHHQQQGGGILMDSFQKSPFLIHHNNNNNNQEEEEEESYLQIKSLINPVFSHLNNLIIPPLSTGSSQPPPPPPPPPPLPPTTANLWADFMGFPFVTDIIVRDHEMPAVSSSSSFGFSRAAGFQCF